ncbi:MAG: HAD family phosphatase [Phycisphaerales bacterium]|nr:HAD family phosphatase [Phycisphaerales bacterium]
MARAVIFDLDGTLADSEVAHERALLTAARTCGMSFTPDYFRERCVGLGEAGCFRMLAAEQGVGLDDGLLGVLVARKLALFTEAVGAGGVVAHAGAVELVRAAGAVMPVAVCSGSSRASVEPMLRAIGLGEAFGVVVTSCDVVRHKPDPEGYLLAAGRLGVEPGACCAIEDSPTGIAAAVSAGMRVVAVGHSFGPERLAGAHEVVGSIAELTVARLRAV